MQSPSRILLPVDFSERSACAARYARLLAERFGSELIFLHVLAPPYSTQEIATGGSMLAELYRGRTEQVDRDLAAFCDAESGEMPVRRVLLEGDPAENIVRYAQEQSIGLIVMPTHGIGPFRRFILGSNTAKVLHDADCPVWTGVHMQGAVPRGAFGHVLCAVDLGPQSSKTLCWAALLARQFDARLTLLHAAGAVPDPGEAAQRKWQERIRESATTELERLRQFVNAEADICIEAGEPAAAICAAAQRLDAGVLVIGRGSAAGVYGRLRTNAYAIIRESPCPVVSV